MRNNRNIFARIAVLLLGISFLPFIAYSAARRSAPARTRTRPAPPAAKVARASIAAAETPMNLAGPDGQDLILEDLAVRAAVMGPLSLTEMEMRFRNPQAREMEGRFSCVLPAGASVSRFAKEVGGRLMEGEVVERLRANRVYDEILHQVRDPALLEQDQGNRFSARVFPIPAGASVRLVLSYTRLLPLEQGVRIFSVPLRGLPTIGNFSFRGVFAPLPGEVRAEVAGASPRLSAPAAARQSSVDVLDWTKTAYRPEEDLDVRWRPDDGTARVRLLQGGDFYLASFRVPDSETSRAVAPSGRWIFYIDTSASGAEGSRHRIGALAKLLAALPADSTVELRAFDQEIVPLGNGNPAELASRLPKLLSQRGYLGGTNLEAVLRDIATSAKADPAARFVLVTDGAATLGKTAPADLAVALERIPVATPLHALVLGARQDAETLALITAGRGRIVNIPFSEALAARAAEAAGRLGAGLGPTLRLADAGSEWLFPEVVHDVQPGTEILAIGKLKPGATARVRLAKNDRELVTTADTVALPIGVFEPLLQREGHRAYLENLAERAAHELSPAVRQALATERIRVSVAQRVMIPQTTLLVLETEEDYRRFGLERRALASILTVGAAGIERLDRPEPLAIAARPAAIQKFAPPSVSETVTVEEGKVEGGVAGGVLGGTVGGEPAPREQILVTGAAPAVDVASAATGAPTSEMFEALPTQRDFYSVAQVAPGAAEDVSGTTVYGSTGAESQNIIDGLSTTGIETNVTRVVESGQLNAIPEPESVKAEPKLDRRGEFNRSSTALMNEKNWNRLRQVALDWQPYDPENPQVYESLGEAALGLGSRREAARAFASLVEIAPSRTELLQRAGLLLLRAGEADLAEEPLRRALELRPDRPNAHRHLALVLWRQGRLEEAARVLERASRETFPAWFLDVRRVIREELAYVYRAWLAKEPGRDREIRDRAAEFGADLTRTDRLRITLVWETDANDVDLHVIDPRGDECFYSQRTTASGLQLYEDVTRGLGPEVVRAERLDRGVYRVGVNYFRSGPMGVSRGILIVLRTGAKGGEPEVQIIPFRLVEAGDELRELARIEEP